MNQILRTFKFDLSLYSRRYGNQSKQCTHYETLRIPQTSSHKEIRQAFIKLSKEIHPDIKGKESHAEFVKVNEAYNILSKETLRRRYDMNLKHGYSEDNISYHPPDNFSHETARPHSEYHYYRQSPHYTSREEWEDYMNSSNTDNYYGIRGMRRMNTVFLAFLLVTIASIVVVVQIIAMNKSILHNRDLMFARSSQYHSEYKKLRDAAEAKTREEQFLDFEAKLKQSNSEANPLDEIKIIENLSE